MTLSSLRDRIKFPSLPLLDRDYFIKRVYARRFDGLSQDEIKRVLSWQFRSRMGYEMDWDNPRTYSQKLNWLKLNYHNPLQTQCADKIGVRDFISARVGEQYVPPGICTYDSVDAIDFSRLPDRFALKVNWGSGQNVFCRNRATFDIEKAKALLRRAMHPHSNHYYHFFEWSYKDIVPKILAEHFLDADDLIDYKFFCFDGRAELILIYSEQQSTEGTCFDFYDTHLVRLPIRYKSDRSSKLPLAPFKLEEMVSVAETLSKGFPHVRVDCFEIRGQVYVGEMTFYTCAGLDPFEQIEYDYQIGDMLKLPKATECVQPEGN